MKPAPKAMPGTIAGTKARVARGAASGLSLRRTTT
jgi:hypothetical protein